MKVAYLTHFFPPTHTAGTETYTYGVAREMQKTGWAVSVVCNQDWDRWGDYRVTATEHLLHAIPVTNLHFNWAKAPDPFSYLFDNPEVRRYLTGHFARLRPDVVHVTSCYTLSGSAVLSAKALGIPVVLTLTDFWFICPKHTLLRGDGSLCNGYESPAGCLSCMASSTKVYRGIHTLFPDRLATATLLVLCRIPILSRRRGLRGLFGDFEHRARFLRNVLNEVEVVISPSNFLKQMFEQHSIAPGKIRVCGHGHDTDWANRFQKRSSENLRVSYIGQIEPIKGVHILVEAARRVTGHRLVVQIYGDMAKNPAYAQHLQSMARDDEKIKFLGPFDRDQVGQVFANTDLLVMPSLWYENAPVVIAEAFASLTPVIATNLGGMSEMVLDGVNGLLFERGDTASLTAALQELADDPRFIEKLKKNIPRVKTVEEDVGELLSIYGGLIDANTRGKTCQTRG